MIDNPLLLLSLLSTGLLIGAVGTFWYQSKKIAQHRQQQQITQQALALCQQNITHQKEQNTTDQQRIQVLDARVNILQVQLSESASAQARLEEKVTEQDHQLQQARLYQEQHTQALHQLEREKAQLIAESQVETERLTAQKAALTQLKQNFEQQQEHMKHTFVTLSERILHDRQKVLTQHNANGLEALLKPLGEHIVRFEERVNQVHTETLKGNSALEAEIKNMHHLSVRMSDEANNLALALKGNAKTRGAWGEAQLERTLEISGLQADTHYQKQASFKTREGKLQQPDYLLQLPQGKHIVIDSKVSLVAYDRWISANNPTDQESAIKAHIQAVKQHMKELSAKDYAHLPSINSPNFVLMFMPIEPAYIEALKHDTTLFEYGYQRNIVLVSHTTLAPILRTIANLWMLEQGQQEAKDISDQAGAIYNTLCTLTERFHKLGNTLQTASTQYNDTITALTGRQGLHGKVERFKQLSSLANKTMPDIQKRDIDYQTSTLNINPATGDKEPNHKK